MNELIVIIILALFQCILLGMKAYQRKDFSILGAVFSRVYLIIVCLNAIITGTVVINALFAGIAIILIGDILANLIYQAQKTGRECEHIIDKLDSITEKYFSAIDNSYIAFFTVDLEGRVEYINHAFATLVGQEKKDILGKSFSSVLETDCSIISEMLEFNKVSCVIKTQNQTRRAVIIGNKTRNGHDTITGSIYLL